MYLLATSPFQYDFSRQFPGMEVFDYLDREKGVKQIEKAKLIIFSGGQDISPEIYKEVNVASYGVNKFRDEVELFVLHKALDLDKKILGVCRGHQLINAALGGKLVQHIENEHPSYHKITDVSSRFLEEFKITGVNSMHHQGVLKVGYGMRATSFYKGLIESTESDRIVTTQFHPEFMDDNDSKPFFSKIIEWANND